MKLTKTLLRDKLYIIAICITIFIAYLSLIKITSSKASFANSDKMYHLIAYFTLTFFWLSSYYKKKKLKTTIVILCIIYGIIIEALQGICTTYRTADFKDIIANALGCIFALLVFNVILKKSSVY